VLHGANNLLLNTVELYCSDDCWFAGHWSADSESAGQRDSWNPAISDDKTAYNDNDSAVSLLTNSANQ